MLSVLYLKHNNKISLELHLGNRPPNQVDLVSHYAVVRQFMESIPDGQETEYLEKIFMEMQAETWSPYGEKSDLLRELGLFHTSMSKQDLVYCDKSHRLWRVASTGFEEVVITDLASGEKVTDNALHQIIPKPSESITLPEERLIPNATEQWEREPTEFEWVL